MTAEDQEQSALTVSCLQQAITDSQDTIRAYDSKAEILGILLTVGLGVTNSNLVPHASILADVVLWASWIFGLAALGALGGVVYPKKGRFDNAMLGSYAPKDSYFLVDLKATPLITVTELAARALDTDWVSELTYVNLRLSLIRQHKDRWFVFSLTLSGITLVLVALTIVMGRYELPPLP